MSAQFNYNDYAHLLGKTKEKGRYLCPVCGECNVTISPDGKYITCHSGGCSWENIRDAVKALAGEPILPPSKGGKYSPYAKKPKSQREKDREVVMETARLESYVDEQVIQVFEGLKDETIALTEISLKCTSEEWNEYVTSKLFQEKLATAKAVKEKSDPIPKNQRLRQAITDYLNESDPFEKEEKRSAIYSSFKINKDKFERLCEAVSQERTTHRAEVVAISGTDFLDEEDDSEEYLIPGFALANSSGLLAGQPGSMKTIWALEMALAVANGWDFYGSPVHRPGKVLFLATDQPAAVTRKYMRKMASKEAWTNVILIALDPRKGRAGWTVKDMTLLEKWLDEYHPTLTIADSIHKIICSPLNIPDKDGNAVAYWMSLTQSIVNRHGFLLWIHHEGKSKEHKGIEKSLGSTYIPAAVDVVMSLERANPANAADHQRIFSQTKTRGFEASRLRFEFDTEAGRMKLLGNADETEEVAVQGIKSTQKILDFLKNNYQLEDGEPVGFESSEVQDATGVPNCRQLLSKLHNRGIVGRRESKTNHRAYVYFTYRPIENPYEKAIAPDCKNAATSTVTTPQHTPSSLPHQERITDGVKVIDINSYDDVTLERNLDGTSHGTSHGTERGECVCPPVGSEVRCSGPQSDFYPELRDKVWTVMEVDSSGWLTLKCDGVSTLCLSADLILVPSALPSALVDMAATAAEPNTLFDLRDWDRSSDGGRW